MFQNRSQRELLQPSFAREAKRESSYLKEKPPANPNRSLVDMTWEKVDYQFTDLKPTPPTKLPARRSFLPNQEPLELKSDIQTQSQKQSDILRQQSYQALVESLSNNNEKQITSQRNEIFNLKLTADEQQKKILKLEQRCALLESGYNEKSRQVEILEAKLLQATAAADQLEKQVQSKDERLQAMSEQLGALKAIEVHAKEALREKDQQIETLEKQLGTIRDSVERAQQESQKQMLEEVNAWKMKFIELNRSYNTLQEKLTIAQAEMDSACKTRDSIISKTNEIKQNNNQRRRTMMVQPFRRDDDEQSNA